MPPTLKLTIINQLEVTMMIYFGRTHCNDTRFSLPLCTCSCLLRVRVVASILILIESIFMRSSFVVLKFLQLHTYFFFINLVACKVKIYCSAFTICMPHQWLHSIIFDLIVFFFCFNLYVVSFCKLCTIFHFVTILWRYFYLFFYLFVYSICMFYLYFIAY